ncbi:hypothetical protein PAAG_02423 [Paracoccidioides lutzii Pb01]|uniref:Uncharacterized protein n=1 Tax=Paracoccidioides lutzii (strain ATCC MYA-826 / Pb01) TaxID=502779 RepID=C1GUV0_PARBA|nr:hypothetical protein PAAG_02423 [Paracoccidioides lutzii Pb01]EEH40368.1 hypothetical protein PAAG_02423 [Paracoccidioides lutzii Pb01]
MPINVTNGIKSSSSSSARQLLVWVICAGALEGKWRRGGVALLTMCGEGFQTITRCQGYDDPSVNVNLHPLNSETRQSPPFNREPLLDPGSRCETVRFNWVLKLLSLLTWNSSCIRPVKHLVLLPGLFEAFFEPVGCSEIRDFDAIDVQEDIRI